MAVRYVRYEGEFVSLGGIAWKVQIWQTNGSYPVGELTFPADEPVVIEWDTKAKEEVICGSSCTVKIISPDDRKYIDLYTVTPGSVGVCIYRKARNASAYVLYWVGTLDAEQYEEPYERYKYYEVMLTFQDFGVWGRLKYNLDGIQKMSDVLADALGRAGLVSETEIASRVNFTSLVSSYHINETSGSTGDPESIDGGTYIGDSTRPSGNPNPSPRDPLEIDTGEERPIYHWGDEGTTPVTPSAGAVLATLDTMAVQSAAFYDEDGEGMTLAEVVESMLLPLGLKIVQRTGKFWVYDINALVLLSSRFSGSISGDDYGIQKTIYWSGDSQTLGTDRVYDKVKLTFDPKADGRIVEPTVEVENVDELFVNVSGAYTSAAPYGNTFYSNYRKKNGNPYDPSDLQFTLFYNIGSATGYGHGFSYVRNGYFKIVGLLGGSDAEGILGKAVLGHAAMSSSGVTAIGAYDVSASQSAVQFTTERVYIPPIRQVNGAGRRWLLRLQLEMLIDVRYNPFTEADEYNEGDNYDSAKANYSYVHVPCNVRLYSERTGGTCKYHYVNRTVAMRGNYDDDYGLIYKGNSMGYWNTGAENNAAADAGCWLSYYANEEDTRIGSLGIGGWKKNRHQIGNRRGKLAADLTDVPEGQYIQYPPDGGWLEISVWNGLVIHKEVAGLETLIVDNIISDLFTASWDEGSAIRWMLYKPPVVDVVNGTTDFDTYKAEDIETVGTATAGAEEDLEIDLTLGTMGKDTPSARGQIYRMVTGLPLRKLTRGGETDTPEKLLLRTLRAQYGGRMTMLSGEASIEADEPHLWTDSNRIGYKMLMLGEVQDLIRDVTDVVLCDVSPDSAAGSDVPATVWFSVTYNLSNVVVSGSMPQHVRIVMPLELELVADEGYRISNVVVRMDGEVVDGAWDSETNTVLVEAVVGDIEIVADAEWAMPYDAQVEWLQTDGTAYINTGYNVANTLRFVVSANVPAVEGSYWIFGGRGQTSNSQALGVSINSANNFAWRYNSGVLLGPAANTSPLDYTFDNYSTNAARICKMNDTTVTASSTASFSTNAKFLVFAYSNAGSAVGGLSGLKIYSVKLYSSGTLVRDYIPVRKNGVGYLWDKVSETLFGNANESGAFSYGNDVTNE